MNQIPLFTSSFNSLSTVFLEANASQGYRFHRWENLPDPSNLYDDNYSLNVNHASIFFSPKTDLTFSAEFQVLKYSLSEVSISNTPNGVTNFIPLEDGYDHFGIYDLNATPATGYVFIRWEGEGNGNPTH